jgi:quercetin dioxygenase-like cupin family protein
MVVEVQVFSPGATANSEGYQAPDCDFKGRGSTTCFFPDGFDLWVVDAVVQPGAVIRWSGRQSEEAIYVLEGEVEIVEHSAGPDCTVAIEAGASGSMAVIRQTHLVHFGSGTTTPSVQSGNSEPCIHVVGPGPRSSGEMHRDDGHIISGYFLDSTCDGCDVTLLKATGDRYSGTSHSHSVDELIHVTRGEIRVGQMTVTSGSTLAVPRNRRYSFRSPGPFEFVNFRASRSEITSRSSEQPRTETAQGLGYVSREVLDARVRSA